jgi:hypothetical protein
VLGVLAGLGGLAACGTTAPVSAPGEHPSAPPNTLSAAQRAAGWQLLFDGRTTDGWRGWGREDVPPGWQVQDGALTLVGAGGDLVTRESFGDFELALQWRVSAGGNSGLFYRAAGDEQQPIYACAPEMQVLDNAAHGPDLDPLQSAGADYALHAPAADVTRPPGQWNDARIVARGAHVEYWLNGVELLEFEAWSDDWEARVAASKFAEMPGYGRARRGAIGLQDHGDAVAFRNIRIRPLDVD